MQSIFEGLHASPDDRQALRFFLTRNADGTKRAAIYNHQPVTIQRFVEDEQFLGLGRVVRPVVMEDLKAMFSDPTRFMHCGYEEAVFDEAIGSGKSFKTSIILSYGLHHLLCLRDPQGYFELDRSSLLTIMNMSVNAVQAKKVVFGELRARIQNSPWFRRFHIDPDVRSELRFEKNIVVLPGHSGATYPLGYNLIMAVMDEAAFYETTETTDTAQEMFYTLRRRIQTRFGGHGGLLVMISSPRYAEDFIERKMQEAEAEPQRIFARRRAIWAVLPDDQEAIASGDCFELDGVRIPNRYKDDFAKNPQKAWRDLGARPSLTLEPYFKQFELVQQCIDPRLKNPILLNGRLAEWFRGDPRRRYFLHIDLGLTRDACGIGMAHREGEEVVVDVIHRIVAGREREIDIGEVRNLVLELKRRGFQLGLVTYDQYQSASSIQELRKHGIKSETFSVDATIEAYETLKELAFTRRLRFYAHDIFLAEMQRLELIEGKKVGHPARGSKDVCDGVAGAVRHALVMGEARVPQLVIV